MTSAAFLLIFRAQGDSVGEQLVDAARAATVRDTSARAREAGFGRVILTTTTPDRFHDLSGVEVEAMPAALPFGACLRRILERHRPTAVCYAGAGMPAMSAEQWTGIRERLRNGGPTLTNNLYSSDILATGAVAALAAAPAGIIDNGLALHLREAARTAVEVLPRSAATLLDIDTPAELCLLALADGVPGLAVGPALHRLLRETAPDTARLEAALDFLARREAEVLVAGRVGSEVWQALERETAARIRVIAEERGMRATQRPRPRSILGFHASAVGPALLVDTLSELADAVFLDTRPLFAHLGWSTCRADRFAADQGRWEAIAHPALRAFTRTVGQAPVPIVLGGHALVSGGLLAAIDIAWARWESTR